MESMQYVPVRLLRMWRCGCKQQRLRIRCCLHIILDNVYVDDYVYVSVTDTES